MISSRVPCRLLLHLLLQIVVLLHRLLIFRFPRMHFEVAVADGEYKEQHYNHQPQGGGYRPYCGSDLFELLFESCGKHLILWRRAHRYRPASCSFLRLLKICRYAPVVRPACSPIASNLSVSSMIEQVDLKRFFAKRNEAAFRPLR